MGIHFNVTPAATAAKGYSVERACKRTARIALSCLSANHPAPRRPCPSTFDEKKEKRERMDSGRAAAATGDRAIELLPVDALPENSD